MNKLLALLLSVLILSCSHQGVRSNWQNKDLWKDGVFGISTNLAYDKLLSGKKASVIVVAVIDSGIDTTQEDLRRILWSNPEDGSHGRNFIPKETGKED